MTVATETAGVDYDGNDVADTFTVPFRFLDNTHVVLTVEEDGVTATLEEGVSYTLTGAGGSSGTAVLTEPLPVGATLSIRRSVPLTQLTSFSTQGTFSPTLHERALDKVTMLAQQVYRAGLDIQGNVQAALDAQLAAIQAELDEWRAELAADPEATALDLRTVVATGTPTARTLADRFADSFNAKDFGAKGDGVTNDTVKLQLALTTLQNSLTHHTLYIPDGYYIVSDELTLAGVYNKQILCGARTVFLWRGSNTAKYVLRLTNCSTISIIGLNIWSNSTVTGGVRTEYPGAGGLYLEHAVTPATGVGQNYFERVYVQGEFPDAGATPPIVGRKFLNGIVAGGAVDSNNDHHRFIGCRIQAVTHTAYDNQFASQATDHTFIGCFFNGGDGYGLQSRSTFYWIGGACNADQDTGLGAFRQTSTSSTPGATVIIGANCESVQRVLVVGNEYPATTSPPNGEGITLIGVRWQTGVARVDGVQPVSGGALTIGTTWDPGDLDGTNGTVGVICPIWCNAPGGISMTGCKFALTVIAGGPRRACFRVASTAGCAVSAQGNLFCGDNYLVQPFIVGALGDAFAIKSGLNVSGNWYHSHYTDTVGGPTPDGTVDHACADLVFGPLGSVHSSPGQVDRQQTVAYAATITVDTRLGSTVHIGTLTGNITSFSMNNGRAGGERFRLVFKQDGTGSRTFPASVLSNNMTFEGGDSTLSTGANTVDMLEGVWDGTLSTWLCVLHKAFTS